jgi:hypothetical protein
MGSAGSNRSFWSIYRALAAAMDSCENCESLKPYIKAFEDVYQPDLS